MKSVGITDSAWTMLTDKAKEMGNTNFNLASALIEKAFELVDFDDLNLPPPGKRGRKSGSTNKKNDAQATASSVVVAASNPQPDYSDNLDQECDSSESFSNVVE